MISSTGALYGRRPSGLLSSPAPAPPADNDDDPWDDRSRVVRDAAEDVEEPEDKEEVEEDGVTDDEEEEDEGDEDDDLFDGPRSRVVRE